MTIDRIEVVCDDPRHEGELGPVDTFVRLAPGGEWITAEQLSEPPARRRTRLRLR